MPRQWANDEMTSQLLVKAIGNCEPEDNWHWWTVEPSWWRTGPVTRPLTRPSQCDQWQWQWRRLVGDRLTPDPDIIVIIIVWQLTLLDNPLLVNWTVDEPSDPDSRGLMTDYWLTQADGQLTRPIDPVKLTRQWPGPRQWQAHCENLLLKIGQYWAQTQTEPRPGQTGQPSEVTRPRPSEAQTVTDPVDWQPRRTTQLTRRWPEGRWRRRPLLTDPSPMTVTQPRPVMDSESGQWRTGNPVDQWQWPGNDGRTQAQLTQAQTDEASQLLTDRPDSVMTKKPMTGRRKRTMTIEPTKPDRPVAKARPIGQWKAQWQTDQGQTVARPDGQTVNDPTQWKAMTMTIVKDPAQTDSEEGQWWRKEKKDERTDWAN